MSTFVTVEQILSASPSPAWRKWKQVQDFLLGQFWPEMSPYRLPLRDCEFLFAMKTLSHSLHRRNWHKGHPLPHLQLLEVSPSLPPSLPPSPLMECRQHNRTEMASIARTEQNVPCNFMDK